jgi:hypothetical protein
MPDLIEPGAQTGQLPGNGSVDAVVGLLQRLRQHIAGEGRKLARSLRGTGSELGREWQRLCQEVAAGRTEAVHAQRGPFLARVKSSLDLLRQVDELARMDRQPLEEREDLSEEITRLERLHARLASRWQDSESLEYLAAEALTPSAEKLDALASKHGFPRAWYDQEDDPFQE